MKNRNLILYILTALAVVLGAGRASAETRDKIEHVILIGLDGWGSYSVPKADMPNVKSLMANGTHTLKKRTVLPSSSAPNWASMFMGAPVELHGDTQWGSQKPELPLASREQPRHFSDRLQRHARTESECRNRSPL